MARQFKQGIDYFPLDVEFFDNEKILLIEAEFGNKGIIIALRLLCKIYNNGYFIKWGEDECLLFSKIAGAEFVPSAVNEIVMGLVRRRFFDKGCFDRFHILTSAAIQEIYLEVAARRKSVDLIREYLLIPVPESVNVNINSINVNINQENDNKSTQSKVKDSIVKKKEKPPSGDKKKKSTEPCGSPAPSESFLKFQEWINEKAPNVGKMDQPFTEEEFLRLKQKYPPQFICDMLLKMHNYKGLRKKNVSANLTFLKWALKDESEGKPPEGCITQSEFQQKACLGQIREDSYEKIIHKGQTYYHKKL